MHQSYNDFEDEDFIPSEGESESTQRSIQPNFSKLVSDKGKVKLTDISKFTDINHCDGEVVEFDSKLHWEPYYFSQKVIIAKFEDLELDFDDDKDEKSHSWDSNLLQAPKESVAWAHIIQYPFDKVKNRKLSFIDSFGAIVVNPNSEEDCQEWSESESDSMKSLENIKDGTLSFSLEV